MWKFLKMITENLLILTERALTRLEKARSLKIG